jgi:hypothetical protein
MESRMLGAWLFVLVPFMAGAAWAADLAGNYVAEEEATVSLSVAESAPGEVTGTLHEDGNSLPFRAKRGPNGFTGRVVSEGEALPLTAVVQGAKLLLTIGTGEDAEKLTFRPAGAVGRKAPATSVATAGTRKLIINGKQLGDAELARLEQRYHLRIDAAEYWYDRTLGAWGVKGGPTRGFILPGLDLGGALRPDASGGGTQVVVNGRVLHPADLQALQQLTGPILPGRYFITAQGLAGYEGGPPQWNLAAMAAQAAQGSRGGSNTWESRLTGASGFSDGTTGAVFLPNGGIVSTGQ